MPIPELLTYGGVGLKARVLLYGLPRSMGEGVGDRVLLNKLASEVESVDIAGLPDGPAILRVRDKTGTIVDDLLVIIDGETLKRSLPSLTAPTINDLLRVATAAGREAFDVHGLGLSFDHIAIELMFGPELFRAIQGKWAAGWKAEHSRQRAAGEDSTFMKKVKARGPKTEVFGV